MALARTSRGQVIDMGALASKNETQRAVGNMNVNARGDLLDEKNRVVQPVTQRTAARYRDTITTINDPATTRGVKGAPPQKDRIMPVVAKPPKIDENELASYELEFEKDDEEIVKETNEKPKRTKK